MSTILEQVKNLPDTPGVYFFLGPKKEILYIGKATSLRDRVKSYFSGRLNEARGPLVVKMVSEAIEIDFQKTDSVLEALILEANLIRKFKPRHNTKEKDDKSWNYVAITKEKWPQVLLIRGKDLHSNLIPKNYKLKTVFGPFAHGSQLKIALQIVRKIFPFRDNKCIPYENFLKTKNYKLSTTPKPCFNRQISLCPGVCTGEISEADYKRQIRNIGLFFAGKKTLLMKTLEKEMKTFAKIQEFEKAEEIKRKIFALQHIQDVALIKGDIGNVQHRMLHNGFRIEAYDVAHMSGTGTVGVMTVIQNGEVSRNDYRMFKIKNNKAGSDTHALREILERRFCHPEWKYPDLMVIDGGIAQKNVADEFLGEKSLTIPTISVVKDNRHKPDHFLGDESLVEKYKREIILVNSEAHRFAIGYHRKMLRRRV